MKNNIYLIKRHQPQGIGATKRLIVQVGLAPTSLSIILEKMENFIHPIISYFLPIKFILV
jgi:hypothetical protein